MIAAGVDAGTKSYGIVAIEGGRVIYSAEVESEEVRKDPGIIAEELRNCDADVAAGLSGYGLPTKKFSELDDVDIFFMTLNLDERSSIGLRKIISSLKNENFYTIPGVVHLPTVPEWRKMNRIDMGTSDKVCSAVLAVFQLSKDTQPAEQTFLLAEVGYGFTAVLAVKNGWIVDGIGGSSGFPGYASLGSLDGEVAYLIGDFPKEFLFGGGVRDFVKERGGDEIEILAEFVLKGLKAVEVSVGKAEICVLSGRFASRLERRIKRHYDVVLLEGFGRGKGAAQGAAIIANAIAGGEFRSLIEHMRILEASGTAFSYLTEHVMAYIRRKFSRDDVRRQL